MRALALVLLALLAGAHQSPAMGIAIVGDQVILSGPVVDDDFKTIPAALAAHPEIRTAVLRYSPGGKMRSAYRVADIFRKRRFTTGVSGFCHSACAIMFLGGTVRGASAFFCQGPTASTGGPTAGFFTCDPVAKTALDLGIVASLDEFRSNDRK